MTESFTISSEQIVTHLDATLFEHKYITNGNDKYIETSDSRFVDTLKAFYLNPETSIKRRTSMLEQFELSGIPNTKIERVEPTLYPLDSNKESKQKILSNDHIGMWKKAHEQKCDGALFFEDDVYFIKNWKYVLQDIFDKFGNDKVDIIRFDSVPFISVVDIPDDNIAVFPAKTFACVGGYYMSSKAISYAISFVEKYKRNWETIEYLMRDIIQEHFTNTTYESSPRICIQNWFLSDTSGMQNYEHMKKIKDIMCGCYLPRYHQRYNFNQDDKNTINRVLEDYKTFNYCEPNLAASLR